MPRFYSKFFAGEGDPTFNITTALAVGGSASRPYHFTPKEFMDAFGILETIIGGSTVCEDPSLYAHMIAEHFLN